MPTKRKCKCGGAYEFNPMFIGDQHRCPRCRDLRMARVLRDRRGAEMAAETLQAMLPNLSPVNRALAELKIELLEARYGKAKA